MNRDQTYGGQGTVRASTRRGLEPASTVDFFLSLFTMIGHEWDGTDDLPDEPVLFNAPERLRAMQCKLLGLVFNVHPRARMTAHLAFRCLSAKPQRDAVV